MSHPLTIALDFDGTFTADCELWRCFILSAQAAGHRVVCITGRRESFEHRRELERALPHRVDVFFAYDEPKADYAKRNRINVDIWIDDMPEMLVASCNHSGRKVPQPDMQSDMQSAQSLEVG